MSKRRWKFWKKPPPPKPEVIPLPKAALSEADVIITPNEVSEKHGTGVILLRFYPAAPNILSIRSHNHYGEQKFGAGQLVVRYAGLARWECYQRMLHALNGSTIRRILCIPYYSDDLISAIVLSDMFQAPICTYLMDDNNIGSKGIPDHLLREVLERSRLRLAISPDLRDAYEKKFGSEFHVMPPLVNSSLLSTIPQQPSGPNFESGTGILLGNVWSQKWLQRLRETVRNTGIKLHWYGNTKASWLTFTEADLAADGITGYGFLPEDELIAKLKTYPYAIIPSGSLDEFDDRPEIARLSQPSRMPYLMAVANIPMIVLGSPETAAAKFVRRFGVGVSSPYTPDELRNAVRHVCEPAQQLIYRQSAAQKAGVFSLDNAGQWIWDSLRKGAPLDDKFDRLMPRDSL
ncbi:MAG: hypothetical protein ACO1QB_17560 [Verrucomicrobiales bacterium]